MDAFLDRLVTFLVYPFTFENLSFVLHVLVMYYPFPHSKRYFLTIWSLYATLLAILVVSWRFFLLFL
jgi:hypothetical protein